MGREGSKSAEPSGLVAQLPSLLPSGAQIPDAASRLRLLHRRMPGRQMPYAPVIRSELVRMGPRTGQLATQLRDRWDSAHRRVDGRTSGSPRGPSQPERTSRPKCAPWFTQRWRYAVSATWDASARHHETFVGRRRPSRPNSALAIGRASIRADDTWQIARSLGRRA